MLNTRMGRRGFLAVAGAGAATALAACGSGQSGSGAGSWEYTDDLGKHIRRDGQPKRIVAYVSCAAALWDFGIHPVGVFGPQRDDDGGKSLQAGNIDLGKVTSVGNGYDDFNIEKVASLKPDLVITGLAGDKPADRWILKDQLADKVEKLAPVLAIQESKKPQPKVIEAYGKLAQRLGADLAGIKKAREEFEKTGEELRSALREKQGLRVEVVYGDNEGMYVANPKFYSDLIYYTQLGMQLLGGAGGADQFYEQLSWERADKYPADLILADSRKFSLSADQMKQKFPTFRQLPAVKANQIGAWNGEPRFSYQLATPELQRVVDAVKKAKPGIAGK
ncbi:ABC transporter substrate-binding protein [Sciscionella marina]|uniref:ABC transporter substrate-binding protein n=1 Tax=Sciscionella marina TaxID=508770 RepID=UPI000365ECAB|nr:ABC transporter substrate-binding protein [Sciscionella marina]